MNLHKMVKTAVWGQAAEAQAEAQKEAKAEVQADDKSEQRKAIMAELDDLRIKYAKNASLEKLMELLP